MYFFGLILLHSDFEILVIWMVPVYCDTLSFIMKFIVADHHSLISLAPMYIAGSCGDDSLSPPPKQSGYRTPISPEISLAICMYGLFTTIISQSVKHMPLFGCPSVKECLLFLIVHPTSSFRRSSVSTCCCALVTSLSSSS